MAMNNQLLAVVQHIENERGVSREIVLTAIEAALQQAAKKNANVTNDVKVVIDRKDGNVDLGDCEYVHRAVLAAFDRNIEDYALTVGSAGIDAAEADEMLKTINE